MSFLRRLAGRPDSASAASDAVTQLRTHPALRRLRPLPPRPTFADWQRLSSEERSALYEPQIDAIRSLSREEQDELRRLIRAAGQSRDPSAVPVLAKIWRTCPASPIRDAAGHALLATRSNEAVSVLWDTRTDWDRMPAHLAVRARLVADPARGVALAEQLLAEADGGDATSARLLDELLRLLAPSSFGANGRQGWTEPDAVDWLRDEERWLDFAVRLRSHPKFGEPARSVLRYQPQDRVQQALAREPAPSPGVHRQPRPVQPWLQRYRAGEHDAVWKELAALGPIVEPAIRDEAERVADDTMRRVAVAMSELARRLESLGYPLRPQPSPDPEVEARLEGLADVAGGPVPISLAAFWRIVGGVDLGPIENADLPDWMPTEQTWLEKLDPVVVEPLREAWYSVEEWQEDLAENLAEVVGPLEISIAPDRLHKLNISGGAPYAIRLPDASADPRIRWLEEEPQLLPYLRRAVQGGGFAGVSPDEHVSPRWSRVVAELTRDLPSF